MRDCSGLHWKKGVKWLRNPQGLGQDCFSASYQRDACDRKARALQTVRGSTQMHLNPILTLHRHHRPIHLIDSSMASCARRCDIADTGVCPPYAHTLLEPHDAFPWITSGGGATWPMSTSWGVVAGRTSGALSLKLIPSAQPCGTYIWGQDRKTSECTVARVARDLQGPWIHGWGGAICVHWWVAMFGVCEHAFTIRVTFCLAIVL